MPKALTQKQSNQVVAKALETGAKQVVSKGVAVLPAGSYPFDLSVSVIGELNVNAGSGAGEEITVIDFSVNDVLRGLMATLPEAETAISEALAWHKNADKDAKKSADAANAATLLKLAKRRKMTKAHATPAKAGAASAKPTVKISGSVAARSISVEVDAA